MILVGLLFTAALDAGSGTAPPPTRPSIRAFEATYVASVEQVPPGIGRLEVWVPLPSDMPAQQVRSIRIESPYPWSVRRERENGNSYLYLAATQPPAGRLDVRVSFEAERREVLRSGLASRGAARPEDLERYLKAEQLVTLGLEADVDVDRARTPAQQNGRRAAAQVEGGWFSGQPPELAGEPLDALAVSATPHARPRARS